MANILPNTLEVQIVRMVKALYDAAPGYTYLTGLKGLGTVDAVSQALNANFATQTNAQWAAAIAANLHLTGGASTAAQNYLIAQLGAGFTRAQVLPAAMSGLASLEADGMFGASALYFNNSVATSYAYSINPANTSTDLAGVLRLADEPNSAPVAVADTASATEGGAAVAGSLATNDTDAEGDALSYSLAATQAPVAGLTLNSNGSYVFDPSGAAYDAIGAGATQSITVNYRVSDGEASSNSTLTITVTGTNDAPVALGVAATGNEDSRIDVTPASTDVDGGDSATYSVVSQPARGTVVFNSVSGKFEYTPSANFNGSDSFTYRVTDRGGLSSTATATVTVAPTNDAPTALGQSVRGDEGSAIAGTVTATDIDGDALTYALGATGPANGTVTMNNATGAFVYTPNAGFAGTDTFTYTASDGKGGTSAPATVSVTVNDVADVLTTGVDNVALSGTGGQTVIGNESTYNSGDSIVGSVGSDTLRLQLDPSFANDTNAQTVTLSSANVSGVELLQISANPANPAGSNGVTTKTVDLLMTNVSTDLRTIELNKSTAQSINIRDIQAAPGALPVVKINDVGANVMIDVDNQDVTGSSDLLKVELNEFGASSTSAYGRSNLTVDSGIETVEITDKATNSSFASDIGLLTGGFSALNVKGGAAGVPLTFSGSARGVGVLDGGFASSASTVTVDSTAFAGNLIADVDGADTVLAGVGNDSLTAHEDVYGLMSMGAGNDTFLGEDDLQGTVLGGAGNDSIDLWDSMFVSGSTNPAPLIDAGDGADSVYVYGNVGSTSSVLGGAGNDTLYVGSGVAGLVDAGADNDTVMTSGTISTNASVIGGDGNDTMWSTGTVLGSITGNAGNDAITATGTLGDNSVVTSPAARGLIDGGDGNDTITQTGTVSEGAIINGGAGNDTITVAGTIEGNLADPGLTPANDNWQVAGAVNAGDGDDALTISSGTFNGKANMGAGNDSVTIRQAVVDGTGAVDLGDGDDSITLQNRSWTAGDVDGLGNDDAIAGGAGTDAMTLASVSDFPTSPAQTATISFAALQANGTMRATFLNTVPDPDAAVVVTVNNAATLADTLAALAAAINANATIAAYWSAAIVSGNLVLTTLALGAGVPLVTFTSAETVTQAGATAETDTGPIVAGAGAGGDRTWSITSDGTGTLVIGDVADGTDITSIESLTLSSADGYNGDENVAVAGVQDNEYDHTFNVALEAYDTALTAINVLERDDSATVNLTGYASEQINVDSDGRSKVTGDGDDVDTYDVTLNINDTQGAGARAANIALNGTVGYLVGITDDARINVMNLAVNGTGDRTVTLDGADQDNNDTVAGEGNSLNITGTSTAAVTITGIYQETVNGSAYAGNQNLTIANDGDGGNENLSITTGAGNDVINMVADNLDLSDVTIAGGAGTDRLIIDNSLRNLSAVDEDFVFKKISSIEELELRGNGGSTLNVSIENDARETGVRTVIASNNAGTRGNINLEFDNDFSTAAGLPAVTVNVESSNIVIDNGADVNMTLNVQAARASAGGTASGALVNFSGVRGTGSGTVDVNVTINATGTTNIGGLPDPLWGVRVVNSGSGASTWLSSSTAGHVDLRTTTGTIDSLTVIDNGTTDNAVNVTWNDGWADAVASFNVSMALANNDPSTPDAAGLATGGVRFVGAAEDDTGFNITASANNDTLWGGQKNDVISAGVGNDWISADPGLGIVVAPGQQEYKYLTFDLTQAVEAGDRVAVTIGGRTYTWTASADAANLGATSALSDLVAAINGAGAVASVTESGNIDDSNNEDDVTASVGGWAVSNDSIYIIGSGVDVNFGYSLGEDHTYATALNATLMNRATAVVDLAGVGSLDSGDIVTINVNGTPYSAAVGAGSVYGGVNGVLDSASELAAALAAVVNGGALMTAVASGTQVTLRGNTASTAYTVTPSWTTDQLTTAATSKTVAISYTAPGAGDSVSATFAGGISVSSTTVAGLAAAINANGTLAPQWNAVAVGNNLTLSADVAGAAAPANDFNAASFTGSGTASWSTTAGTNAVTRTDNTDPTLAARTATFTFADGSYDAGDVVAVTVNGVTTNVTLGNGGTDTTNDVNLTGAQVATQVSAAVAAAGVSDSAVANEVRFDAGAGNTATYSVTVTDITQTGPTGPTPDDVAEYVTIDYTAVIGGATGYSATINGTTISGTTLGNLVANINASGVVSGANGYDAVLAGNVIQLTGPANGTEPFGVAEPGDAAISGAATSDGGAVTTTTNDPADAAIRRVIDVEYTGAIASTDGADITIEGVSYSVDNAGSVAATLAALAAAVNAATGTHGWTASVNAGDLRLTGPADGSDPDSSTGTITVASIRDDDGTGTIGAATAADPTNGEQYTATLTLTSGVPTSISITFDTNDNDTVDVLDTTLTGTNTTTLASLINSTYGIGGTAGNTATTDATFLSASAASATQIVITGMSLGTGSTNQPLLVTFGGATGTASVSLTAAGDPTENPWSQIYTVTGLTAGDTTVVRFSNGTSVSVPFNTDAATTLTDIGTAIETALFPAAVGVVSDPAGANNVQVAGPNSTTTPAITVSSIFVYQTVDVLPVTVVTAGAAGDAANVHLDFTNWNASNEIGSVTFANGETFSAAWNTDLATSLAALKAAIEADTTTNGDVNGAASWATITVVGSELRMVGPVGLAPDIDFISAAITATNAATAAEVRESWDNTDNNNPTVTVTSGAANAAPTLTYNSTGVAAATAAANGSDSVTGGDGNDTIFGQGGHDTLFGDAGADEVYGGEGNDQTWGGAGSDWLDGGNGNDAMDGAEGNDTMYGGAGSDNLSGGDGADYLVSGDSSDTVSGGAGDDFIRGGAGRDSLTGGDGTDVFYFSAIGTASESQGAVSFSDVVNDFVSGVDKFQFDFTVNFYANVTNTTNLLAGLTDLSPAAGAAAGRAIYDSSAKVLYVDVNGDGAITASDDIVLDLTQTAVTGMSLSDFINTGALTGTSGNDLMIGTGAGETMSAGDGNDTLFGAGGVDTLTGGTGSDTFHFASTGDSTNTITDFVSGTDKLQFTATTVSYAGQGAALGTNLSSSPAAGKAFLVVTGSNGVLNVDVDGNGTADVLLSLTGVTSLTAGDFLAPEPTPGV